MDYKKLIPSRRVRLTLLSWLDWLPDALMLRLQYRIKTGRWPDLRTPRRFTEKVQWYKLFWRDPLMRQCADKYEVRDYVRSCGLEHILNDCYGVFSSPEEIDFAALPERFVLKDTLGAGSNEVIIVRDKAQCDWNALKKRLAAWVRRSPAAKNCGREWVYEGRPHRIIAERYIPCGEGEFTEYKFFCFNGQIRFLYIQHDRVIGKHVHLGVFLLDGSKLPVSRCDELPLERDIIIPHEFPQMISYAERLAQGFPHVRVDFYHTKKKIIFGEMTFFDGSGYMTFTPDSFDFDAGAMFELPPAKRSQ